MFSERLDFLMKMTDTTNSALGHAVSLDPSYISKIRRGIRNAPKHEDIIESISDFLARRLTDDKRRGAVSDVVLKGFPFPSDPEAAAKILDRWLRSGSSGEDGAVSDLIKELSFSGGVKGNISDGSGYSVKCGGSDAGMDIFYGNEGKRAAAKAFLSYAAENASRVHTLLLFSNEDMRWMYESQGFLKEWAGLLILLLRKGAVIKIIHTVTRDLNEMIEAVKSWIPLYSEGSVEPYFCPKLRDDIYRRSLFVIPGLCAMTSTSVGSATEGRANMVFYDQRAVESFEGEFRSYFAICKPLMNIVKEDIPKMLYRSLQTALCGSDHVCIAGPNPSFLTLPEKYLAKAPSDVKKAVASLKTAFIGLLTRGIEFTEAFTIPDTGAAGDGRFRAIIWPGYDIAYTKEVLQDQMSEIRSLTEKYGNYNVIVSSAPLDRMQIATVEDGEALLITSDRILFQVSERNISEALFEFIERLPGERRREKIAGLMQ